MGCELFIANLSSFLIPLIISTCTIATDNTQIQNLRKILHQEIERSRAHTIGHSPTTDVSDEFNFSFDRNSLVNQLTTPTKRKRTTSSVVRKPVIIKSDLTTIDENGTYYPDRERSYSHTHTYL